MEVLYRTEDGKTFTTKEEALHHEMELAEKVRVFEIYAHPELNEGAYPAKFKGYLLIHANEKHVLFAENWCYQNFGNRVEFIMGVLGSNAIVENWRIVAHQGAYSPEKVIGRVEENFVKHLWD